MAAEHAYIFVLLLLAGTGGVYSKSTYKICVPVQYMKACEEMLEVPTKSKAVLECVPARDRVDCLYYVQQRQADIVPVDPEDMYVASKIPNQDFVVFQEYRTEDEPDAEFRYQAVIVVHKDLPINNLDQLKGLKSCHTGVNRNVGYKIPLTMLMKRAIFPKMNDHSISPKENELKALSTFFKKSCIVGKWSPDDATNTAWKTQYSQLCALCEHPDKCDYPDNFSGYEGALRCLAHNGGEVAFTKVIYVRKFFGLPVGTIPASPSNENPDEFRYLCSDGSKVPIRDKACSWAARPWQGLLGHNDVLASLSPIREKIKQLANIGATTKAEWFTNVLGLSEKIQYVADNIPIKPVVYLKKANYTEVIERGHGAPEPVVRMCVTSNVALAKCRAMSVFAFSRDIRPRLDCVQESSTDDCLRSVQDNGSDLTSVDDIRDIGVISRFTTLNPVFHEVYGEKKTPNYAVAVVKKNTAYDKIEDLKGKRSCHEPYGSFSGLDAPLYYLIKKTLIKADQCVKNLGEYFSGGSCLPGVEKPENNPKGADVSKLKKQCSTDNSPAKCLQEDRGDVAFVSSGDLSNFDSSQYELLCLNKGAGGRDSLNNYASCNIALAPSRTWLSAKETLSDVAIYHTPLSLAELLDSNTGLFNIYGEFLKNNNVIFNNAATGLTTVPKDQRDTYFSKFKEIRDTISSCN